MTVVIYLKYNVAILYKHLKFEFLKIHKNHENAQIILD